jgi:glycine cleavage system H lipoate-binding protein
LKYKLNKAKLLKNTSQTTFIMAAASVRRISHLTLELLRQPTSLVMNQNIFRLMSTRPTDYDNEFYWLKHVENNEYAFGIKQEFIEEHGDPEMIMFDSEMFDILQKGEEFGTIENTKAVQILEAPFNNCILYDFTEDIDFEVVVQDPENIDNRICTFREEDASNANSETYQFSMPLL